MNRWSAPCIATRTGARHRRRGLACQDASGWWRLPGPSAETHWAMAVADGHGGARYRRSREGSAIACRVALAQVAAHDAAPLYGAAAELTAVRRTLAHTLPQQIVKLWLETVQQHWQQQPLAGSEPFSPILYGTTLGLVLLTPRWWAHTGLGDWDLVRIDADGQTQLLSEEGDVGGRGEATTSLCLADAAVYFSPRTRVHRLRPDGPPFSLVLSTDGIRKSCSTDSDFFTLARHLATSGSCDGAPGRLAADLDHISAQGSGDDVSVAIACWGEPAAGQQDLDQGWPAGGRIEQPAPLETTA